MKLLLDTHVLLWLLGDPSRVDESIKRYIEDIGNAVFISSASAWEIATKHSLGKLTLPEYPEALMARALNELQAAELPINNQHALLSASLPKYHNDPFDRLLLSQAKIEDASLVTADNKLRLYSEIGVNLLWV